MTAREKLSAAELEALRAYCDGECIDAIDDSADELTLRLLAEHAAQATEIAELARYADDCAEAIGCHYEHDGPFQRGPREDVVRYIREAVRDRNRWHDSLMSEQAINAQQATRLSWLEAQHIGRELECEELRQTCGERADEIARLRRDAASEPAPAGAYRAKVAAALRGQLQACDCHVCKTVSALEPPTRQP